MAMRGWHEQEILIVAKTYPQPSEKYREVSCTAGITREGKWIRLHPVPFRHLESERQFKRWAWIRARVKKSEDPRTESHKVDYDSISVLGARVGTRNAWAARRRLLQPLQNMSMEELYALQELHGANVVTMGFVRPKELLGLDVKFAGWEWSQTEFARLSRPSFFDSEDGVRLLRKVPYDFHYRFECDDEACKGHRLKIADWEAGQLFWNCWDRHGDNWEAPFRQKLEDEARSKWDMHFLVGTVRLHPRSWIIGGLFYPPKTKQPLLL